VRFEEKIMAIYAKKITAAQRVAVRNILQQEAYY